MMIFEVHIIFLDNFFSHKYKLNIFTVVYCFIKIQKIKGCLEKKKSAEHKNLPFCTQNSNKKINLNAIKENVALIDNKNEKWCLS